MGALHPKVFRTIMAACVVRHDLPLTFCEYEGVKDLFSYLNLDVEGFSRRITKTTVVKFTSEMTKWNTFCNPSRVGCRLHLTVGLLSTLVVTFQLLPITLIIIGFCIRES